MHKNSRITFTPATDPSRSCAGILWGLLLSGAVLGAVVAVWWIVGLTVKGW